MWVRFFSPCSLNSFNKSTDNSSPVYFLLLISFIFSSLFFGLQNTRPFLVFTMFTALKSLLGKVVINPIPIDISRTFPDIQLSFSLLIPGVGFYQIALQKSIIILPLSLLLSPKAPTTYFSHLSPTIPC